MGTRVHSNMQLPRYYSLTNLNDNSGDVAWPLHREYGNSGPYNDLFMRLTKGYDKEKMRQTIMKHDSIFRHQLHELHRLYRIQRDLMNEIKSEDRNKHLIPVATSHLNSFSCGFMTEDEQKRCQTSESHFSDLNCFKLSTSGATGIHSHINPLKENAPQPSFSLTQDGFKLRICESSESQPNKVRTGLFDLECPPEKYINNEDGARGVSAKRSYQVPSERDGILSMGYDSNYSSNGEATSFNLTLKRYRGLTDLNEPIPEEASTSACFSILGNISCSKKEVPGKDLSSMSQSYQGIDQKGAEFFQEPGKARERWTSSLNNPDLEVESRQNGWFSSKFGNGQTRTNVSFHPEDLRAPCKLVQVEATEAQSAMFHSSDQNKRETIRKQNFFGVELPENSSGESAVTSHGLNPMLVHSWSNVAHSEILSGSSRDKFYGNSSQSGSRIYGKLNTSSTTLLHDITVGKVLVDSNSRSLSAFQAEKLARNDFFTPSDCKESQGCGPSAGFCNRNGISESIFTSEQFAQHGPKFSFKTVPWMMEAKSIIDLNAGALAPHSYDNEEISQSDFVSVNGSIKQNSNEGLSWLRATRLCNVKPIKDVEGSHQMNLDSLQNCSQQFIDKSEMRIQDPLSTTCVDYPKNRKSNTSFLSSNTKLLGFSMSENICQNLPSPNSPLRRSSPVSAIDGINFVMTNAPVPPKCGQQCLVEGPNGDKRSINLNANVGHIDLNLCAIEEEIEDVQSTSSSVRTSVRIAEIDLEIPVTTEMGTKDTSDHKSLENNLTKPSHLLHGEIDESRGILSVSMAAEALVAISSSCVIDLQHNVSSDELEVSTSNSLYWFAEIVTSCRSDTENDVGSANGACLDDSIPDEIDIFELMTLNLKQTEVEECCYKPQVQENEKSEETLPRRPRRGQARRGRQRKDFQRDVLPNLTSLSRNEMTEDFQMIEGLIRAIGGSWQSSLTQKNSAKRSTGRGRKRGAESSPPTTTEECSNQNQFQQTKTGLEETSLTGWGKRTRRPPRPRCLPLAIK